MPTDAAPSNPQATSKPVECDICILGGGSAGVQVAVAAAALGKRVVLVEKHKLGGESLNYGCIPSKALIEAAKRAHAMRSAWAFGLAPVEPQVDFEALQSHVSDVIDRVGLNSSAPRLAGLGVRVIVAAGRFISKSAVQAGEVRIAAERFVIATGSSPVIPPIEGLSEVPFLTNETILGSVRALPELIVLGAGPDALELAQAYRRLGSKVTVLDKGRALAGEDPEMAVVVVGRLHQEGVAIREGVRVVGAQYHDGRVSLKIESGGAPETVEGSDLLIAGKRKPNISDLGLDAAGIVAGQDGIVVDRTLRTRNRRVYAIGDAVGSALSATAAREQAGIVVRRAVLGLPAKADASKVPRVMFTDPELASIGLSEEAARSAHGKVRVLRWPYYENDRAQTAGCTEGHIKVVTTMKGRILGASVVGANATEMISLWSLALSRGLAIGDMTNWAVPYPALAEISNRAAFRAFSMPAGNSISRKIIALLAKLG